MTKLFILFRHATRRYARDEAGSATIEALLWIPIYLLFMMLVFDASMMFAANANIQRVVYDGNRQFVDGKWGSDTQLLEDWISATMNDVAPPVSVNATVDGTSGLLTTEVVYRASDTDLTGATSMFSSLTLRVSATHQTES